jgi:hypothetical protein
MMLIFMAMLMQNLKILIIGAAPLASGDNMMSVIPLMLQNRLPTGLALVALLLQLLFLLCRRKKAHVTAFLGNGSELLIKILNKLLLECRVARVYTQQLA